MKRIVPIVVALALVAALLPATAEAKPVRTKLDADVVGIIDRHARVGYVFVGAVYAKNFTFPCLTGRTVVLYRVESGGTSRPVVSTRTGLLAIDPLLGAALVTVPIRKPIDAIPGNYFAMVKRRVVKTKRGRLTCLADRTPTFRVDVPPGLLTPPVVR